MVGMRFALFHNPVQNINRKAKMPIREIITGDIFDDLRRGDHIVFSLNAEGIHPDDNVGYSFVNAVIEDYATDYKSQTKRDIGKIVTVESDEYNCWFHGIVNHSINLGWPESPYPSEINVYRSIQEALTELEQEFSPTLPMKSLWLGRGKMRGHGEIKGDVVKCIQAMTNSEAELRVYIDGDLDD